jgi:hypothetical protein
LAYSTPIRKRTRKNGHKSLLFGTSFHATGFTLFEFGISAKWLELLKEIAPDITRVAVIRDPTARSGGGQLGAIQGVAPALGVEVRPIDSEEADAIKHDLVQFAREPRRGLIVTTSRLARAPVHRELILTLAAEQRLPAIYAFRVYAVEGGLMAYSPSTITPFRRAAAYVDRILKGEKPTDLLVGGVAASQPFAARAQQTKSPARIGMLPIGLPSNPYDKSLVEAFRLGLHEVGLIENRDIILDVAWAGDDQAVNEVLRRGADILIPCGSSASVAANRKTSTIPIMFLSVVIPSPWD